jgi:uncharacterized alpha-E superfamily protein
MGRRRVACALVRTAPHALVLAPRDADARVMANTATDASAATAVVVEVARARVSAASVRDALGPCPRAARG